METIDVQKKIRAENPGFCQKPGFSTPENRQIVTFVSKQTKRYLSNQSQPWYSWWSWTGSLVLLLLLLGWPQWLWAQGTALPSRNAIISLAVMPGAPDKVLAGTLN
ncbi:MAG: hypothetical protein KDE58_33470, partial [Caldilineaceae bacterium]|nr:hypothetical protein [Caldilineaceae bacterium]